MTSDQAELKPGSKAFAIHRDKLLFILRDDNPQIEHPNLWCLPGGGMEPGETHEQAMLREFEEELGIRPKDFRYLGKLEMPGRPLVYRYLVRLDDSESSALRLGNEGQRFAFFTMEEVATLAVSPRQRIYLDRIAGHLKEIVNGGSADAGRLGLVP